MNICIDMHTHTTASGHGYSTLQENIAAAKEAGLTVLGLSEHGMAMPGGPHEYFFGNYKCIPREYDGLRLLCGVEANIMDRDGTLDMEESLISRVDYAIASLHIPCIRPGSIEENTQTLLNAMKNPYVKIIGHPDDSRYPLDFEELVRASAREKVALEVNNSSLHPKSARTGGRENITALLRACKRQGVPVLLGSDSHISYTVGRFDAALALLRELDFPEELVLNTRQDSIGQLVNVALD